MQKKFDLAIFLINKDLRDSIYKQWNRYLKASERYCTGNEGVLNMISQEKLPDSLTPKTQDSDYGNFELMCESKKKIISCLDKLSQKRKLLKYCNSTNPNLNTQKNAAQELFA